MKRINMQRYILQLVILIGVFVVSCTSSKTEIGSKSGSEELVSLPSDSTVLVNGKLISSSNDFYTISGNGDDLADSKVGVLTGGIGEVYYRKNFTRQPYCYDDYTDALASLNARKVKYVIAPYSTCRVAIIDNPNLALLTTHIIDEVEAFGFNKHGSDSLINLINLTIQEMLKDGTVEKIIPHWINQNRNNYPAISISQVSGNEPLRVGVCSNREPMCFKQNGNITGFECEIALEVAKRAGFSVEFVDMKSMALPLALLSNRVDMIVSNYTPTVERQKLLSFSTIFYHHPLMLLTNVENCNSKSIIEKNFSTKIKENLIVEKRYLLILKGFNVTLIISFFTVLLGTFLGAFLCRLQLSKNSLLKRGTMAYCGIIRLIPNVVLLLFMFYVFLAPYNINGSIIAILTFTISFSVTVANMFRVYFLAIPNSQKEAAVAMGFSKWKTLRWIIFPQVLQKVFPLYKGAILSMVKMTSIVGYVAIGDLTKVGDMIRCRTFDAFIPLIVVAVIYFLLAKLLAYLLSLIQVNLAPKRSVRKQNIHNKYFKNA